MSTAVLGPPDENSLGSNGFGECARYGSYFVNPLDDEQKIGRIINLGWERC